MVRTIEAYHDVHLCLAQSGKLVRFLHDSSLALSECIFSEARNRTGHSGSLRRGSTLTIFSKHEERDAEVLTVSVARLQQRKGSSCFDVGTVHRSAGQACRQVMRTCVLYTGI